MLERIVESGHFRKFDRSIQILSEPELLEVCNVPDVPYDRTHQGVMLSMQVFVGEPGNEQQRPLSRCREEMRDVVLGWTEWGGKPRRNHLGGGSINSCNDIAVPRTC